MGTDLIALAKDIQKLNWDWYQDQWRANAYVKSNEYEYKVYFYYYGKE